VLFNQCVIGAIKPCAKQATTRTSNARRPTRQ